MTQQTTLPQGTAATGNNYYTGNYGSINSVSYAVSYGKPAQTQNPDLPYIVLETYDINNTPVFMTMDPEYATMTPAEVTKLLMLIFCHTASSETFCALAFVKKNNLERHFTFKT